MSRDQAGAETLRGSLRPRDARKCARTTESSEGWSRLWGAGRRGDSSPGRWSAREEAGRNPGRGLRRRTLEGRNPWEHPPWRRPKKPFTRPGLSRGRNPRNRSLRGRPYATASGSPAGQTVGGTVWVVTLRTPRREPHAPKGESHERCRYETRPARDRREKTARRVAKPWRRNVAGRQTRVRWTFDPSCAVGTQSPWEVPADCGPRAR